MPDEDKHFGGFLALDFRKWWRPVKTIYCSSNIDDVCSLLLLYVLYHNTFIFGRLKVFSSLLEMDGGYALLASRTYFGESAIETSKTNTAGKSRYQLQFENYHEFFFFCESLPSPLAGNSPQLTRILACLSLTAIFSLDILFNCHHNSAPDKLQWVFSTINAVRIFRYLTESIFSRLQFNHWKER